MVIEYAAAQDSFIKRIMLQSLTVEVNSRNGDRVLRLHLHQDLIFSQGGSKKK